MTNEYKLHLKSDLLNRKLASYLSAEEMPLNPFLREKHVYTLIRDCNAMITT